MKGHSQHLLNPDAPLTSRTSFKRVFGHRFSFPNFIICLLWTKKQDIEKNLSDVMKKVVVIGSGISGLSAAYGLSKTHKVTLLEKASYFGGHSNTVDMVSNNKTIAVDTGFIVFNHRTYPNLISLFSDLSVPTEKSDMSFGVTVNNGQIQYAGSSIDQFFAQRYNLLNPKFLKMGLDIVRFNKAATTVDERALDKMTLGDFISRLDLGQGFRDWYLYPMAAAIWSTSTSKIPEYPARSFIQFFKNHGLLTITDHPQWYTVSGGSREYVKRILDTPNIDAQLKVQIDSIHRHDDHVEVTFKDQDPQRFDECVIATHAPTALSLLANPTTEEQQILGAFRYSKNKAYLHKDPVVMPRLKKAWASWIYSDAVTQDSSDKNPNDVSVSYWMNNLQNLDTTEDIFVTLNPTASIKKDLIERIIDYDHPIFDAAAIKAQSEIHHIQGKKRTWFCGAYQRYGFHEDGIWSARRVLEGMGITPSWCLNETESTA